MNAEILTQLSPDMIQKVKGYLNNKSLFNLNLSCKNMNYIGVSEKEMKLRNCDLFPLSKKKINDFSCGHLFCIKSIIQFMSSGLYNKAGIRMTINDVRKKYWRIFLRPACLTNNLESVKYLVELFNLNNPEGVHDITKCSNILEKTTEVGHIEIIKYFMYEMELSCSYLISDYTILLTASEYNRLDIVKLVVEYLYDKNIHIYYDEYYREQAMEACKIACDNEANDVIIFLLEHFKFDYEELDFEYIFESLYGTHNLKMIKFIYDKFHLNKAYAYVDFCLEHDNDDEQTECVNFLLSSFEVRSRELKKLFIITNKNNLIPYWLSTGQTNHIYIVLSNLMNTDLYYDDRIDLLAFFLYNCTIEQLELFIPALYLNYEDIRSNGYLLKSCALTKDVNVIKYFIIKYNISDIAIKIARSDLYYNNDDITLEVRVFLNTFIN